jgi:membrane AbrB-like protein
MHWAVTLGAAIAGGVLAERLRLPGGLLLGAMVGSAAVTLGSGVELVTPFPAAAVLFVAVGVMIGTLVTRDRLHRLAPMAWPAVASAAVLIVAGVLVAWLLQWTGLAPPAAVLATSPGALVVLIAAAAEYGRGETEVALFHVIRIVVVVATVSPLVRWLRRRPRGAR